VNQDLKVIQDLVVIKVLPDLWVPLVLVDLMVLQVIRGHLEFLDLVVTKDLLAIRDHLVVMEKMANKA
jgi:hypothetical protein